MMCKINFVTLSATSSLPALYERTEFYKNEVNEYFEEQAQLIPPEGVNIDGKQATSVQQLS